MQIWFKLICTLKFCLQNLHTQIWDFLSDSSHYHHQQHRHSGSGLRSIINTSLPLTGQHSASFSPFICISSKRWNTKHLLQNISGAESLKNLRRSSAAHSPQVPRSTNTAASPRIQPQILYHRIRVVFVLSDSTRVRGNGGVVSSLFASIPDIESCVVLCILSRLFRLGWWYRRSFQR